MYIYIYIQYNNVIMHWIFLESKYLILAFFVSLSIKKGI